MKLKYPKSSIFLPIFYEWIDKNIDSICNHDEIYISIEPRTGFNKEKAEIVISEDPIEFESNWKYKPKNFPTRLRAFAKSLYDHNVFGEFQLMHYSGKVTLKKVEQLNPADAKQWRG